jgi:glutathione S-transferase
MTRFKLTYFDIDGGRGEAIRLAFRIGGIEFEDVRLTFAEFGEARQSFPFKALPVLEIDDQPVTQSNSLARYVGKLVGLYPTDDLQALYCDEAMDAVEDLSHAIGNTFGLKDDELKQAREKLVRGPITKFNKGPDGLLARGGGQYFADRLMTVADLKVFVQTRALTNGVLDHVPTDVVERLAPSLAEHLDRITNDPRVAAYYAQRCH